MAKRRNFSADFKARVALEPLYGAYTMAELASKHKVHPNMIGQWKRKAQESLPDVFAKIGQMYRQTKPCSPPCCPSPVGQIRDTRCSETPEANAARWVGRRRRELLV